MFSSHPSIRTKPKQTYNNLPSFQHNQTKPNLYLAHILPTEPNQTKLIFSSHPSNRTEPNQTYIKLLPSFQPKETKPNETKLLSFWKSFNFKPAHCPISIKTKTMSTEKNCKKFRLNIKLKSWKYMEHTILETFLFQNFTFSFSNIL